MLRNSWLPQLPRSRLAALLGESRVMLIARRAEGLDLITAEAEG